MQDTVTKDTIIQYNFHKNDLKNLRIYIVDLEKYKSLFLTDEQIIAKQKEEILNYQALVSNYRNKDLYKDVVIKTTTELYNEAEDRAIKFERQAKR